MLDRAETRRALGISPDARILLYVGRLAREKNLSVLLEGAAEIFRNDPRARLWLVGDGPYRQECYSIARRLNIGDRIKFVGFVPRSEVDKYYAAADLFLFASITETQGLVVQEAMTHGLPAIVVAGGGASASVIDGVNGFIVKDEPGELAFAAGVLSNDELYARLAEQAPRTVRDLGVPAMGERVQTVYRQVIREQRVIADPNIYASV